MTDAADAPPPAGRPWTRLVLGGTALLLIPCVLALVVLAAKFRGLALSDSMERAQIARRVAEGRGLSTDSIRPISLALQPSLENHPDLYHPPLPSLLLGAVFAVLHPSDRVAAAFGLLLWVASVLLTFWVARRWWGTTIAALATAFYAFNISMLKSAALGLPYPLIALFLLGYAFLAAPKPGPAVEGPPPPTGPGDDLRIVGAGALAALAGLSHYLLLFFAPAAGLHLVSTRRRRGRAALLFLAGFAVVLAPWMIRNFRYGRSPFFSLYWFEALAGTDLYPGDVIWRSMSSATTGPWEFLFSHPLQAFRKASGGLIRFWQESLPIVDPVVAFLSAAALLRGRDRGPWHGWLGALAGGIALSIGASCVFRAEPELLLCWTPLLAIPAAAQAVDWLRSRVEEVSLRRYWSFRLIPSLFREPAALRAVLRRGAAASVLAVVAFPIFHYLWIYRVEPSPGAVDGGPLAQAIPPGAVVMTDQPAVVSWRANRRAVWLPLEEKEWDAIEARGGPVTATYVSPAVVNLLPNSKAGWWWWIGSPRGVYRDLAPVEAPKLPGVLRLRGREKG